MKHTAQGYIVAFDRSLLNLSILQKVLKKRHIKTFGTNNLFRLLNYLNELKTDALLVNILESYSLGSKRHRIMLLNKYAPNAESFCDLIPELNDSNCFEVHSSAAAQQYLQKNSPDVICVEYGQKFVPAPHLLHRPHIFYVDRQQDIAEIRKFLQ